MTTITSFMSKDHDELDGALERARGEADPVEAKRFLSRFVDGLKAHIGWEEDILFPAFEEKTGLQDSGPTAVMRLEHRRIEELLDALGESFGTAQVEAHLASLIDVLTAHNQKEEDILYPWLDRSLSASEVADMLARIEAACDGN